MVGYARRSSPAGLVQSPLIWKQRIQLGSSLILRVLVRSKGLLGTMWVPDLRPGTLPPPNSLRKQCAFGHCRQTKPLG